MFNLLFSAAKVHINYQIASKIREKFSSVVFFLISAIILYTRHTR